MDPESTGKVLVAARLENVFDLEMCERGFMRPDEIRRVEVLDARAANRLIDVF